MKEDWADHAKTIRYRGMTGWSSIRKHWVDSASDIPERATVAGLGRVKALYRGVGKKSKLRTLYTSNVDQEFLAEICTLPALEYLWLGWPVTAHDLSPLEQLENLHFLKVDTPRKIEDFSPITRLPRLTSLFIENPKHLDRLDWLQPLQARLWSLGIEGSISKILQIASLAPLAGFTFEALFLTSVRLKDKSLMPLGKCRKLKYLKCARFAPKTQFEALKAQRPDIDCPWFHSYEVQMPEALETSS